MQKNKTFILQYAEENNISPELLGAILVVEQVDMSGKDDAFILGIHPSINQEHIEYMKKVTDEFFISKKLI